MCHCLICEKNDIFEKQYQYQYDTIDPKYIFLLNTDEIFHIIIINNKVNINTCGDMVGLCAAQKGIIVNNKDNINTCKDMVVSCATQKI